MSPAEENATLRVDPAYRLATVLVSTYAAWRYGVADAEEKDVDPNKSSRVARLKATFVGATEAVAAFTDLTVDWWQYKLANELVLPLPDVIEARRKIAAIIEQEF